MNTSHGLDALFRDTAVVLLGHGTKLNPDSARSVLQHSADLAARGLFAEVRPAFWKQAPFIRDVLAGLHCRRVVIVPMFISEGYFSDEVIPRELGFSPTRPRKMQTTSGACWYYAGPVGTHPRITALILSRAGQVLQDYPPSQNLSPSEITLFVVGHGTGRNENSRAAVKKQVRILSDLKKYAAVRAAFMEEEPLIKDFRTVTPTKFAIVVPFFVSNGLHVMEDIPVLMGEKGDTVRVRTATGKPSWKNPTQVQGITTWYTPAVGTHPALVEVILDRVRECVPQDQP